jgi:hypothetical protein
MFRFTHTAADEKAIKAVFTTLPETTPTAMHFNMRSAGAKGEERLSANQIAFKLSVGASREYGELQKARTAIAQHKKYQDHVAANAGQPVEVTV